MRQLGCESAAIVRIEATRGVGEATGSHFHYQTADTL
jgi:hypothetical protein